MRGLSVGKLAGRAGVKASTVRYYERRGLLRPAPRSAAGYRLYGEHVADEIHFIKRAQALGLSLFDIREVLELGRSGRKPCSRVIGLVNDHLTAVDERIRRLTRFRKELTRAVKKWRRHCGFMADGLCELMDPVLLPDRDTASPMQRRYEARVQKLVIS